jgi:hypothetical protein
MWQHDDPCELWADAIGWVPARVMADRGDTLDLRVILPWGGRVLARQVWHGDVRLVGSTADRSPRPPEPTTPRKRRRKINAVTRRLARVGVPLDCLTDRLLAASAGMHPETGGRVVAHFRQAMTQASQMREAKGE